MKAQNVNAPQFTIRFYGGPWDGSSLPCSESAFNLLLTCHSLFVEKLTPITLKHTTYYDLKPHRLFIEPKPFPTSTYTLTTFSPNCANYHWMP